MSISWWIEQAKRLVLGFALLGAGVLTALTVIFGLTETTWLWKVILGATAIGCSWALGAVWRWK